MSTTPLRKPPRWVRWTVAPLLILVPIGYVLISAAQSHGGGQEKKQQAAAEGLTHLWPTKVQRRIYQVAIPPGSADVAYLETNSWQTSTLYVQFLTNAGGLDTFLAQVGTSRTALKQGKVTITGGTVERTGWRFGPHRQWAGVELKQHGDKPDHDITVDFTNPDHPRVYVASMMDFKT